MVADRPDKPAPHTSGSLSWLRAVQAAIRVDEKASPTWMAVFTCLCLHMNPKGSGEAAQRPLAEGAGVSQSTVKRALGWGRRAGFLIRKRRGHRLGDGETESSAWQLALPQPVTGDPLSDLKGSQDARQGVTGSPVSTGTTGEVHGKNKAQPHDQGKGSASAAAEEPQEPQEPQERKSSTDDKGSGTSAPWSARSWSDFSEDEHPTLCRWGNCSREEYGQGFCRQHLNEHYQRLAEREKEPDPPASPSAPGETRCPDHQDGAWPYDCKPCNDLLAVDFAGIVANIGDDRDWAVCIVGGLLGGTVIEERVDGA